MVFWRDICVYIICSLLKHISSLSKRNPPLYYNLSDIQTPMLCILLLVSSIFLQPTSCSLSPTSQSVSPLTASSPNTSYSYSFNSTGQAVPSSAQFIVQFDTGPFSITQATNCVFTVNGVSVAGVSCTPNSGANTITFTGVTSSATTVMNMTVAFYTTGAVYSGSTWVSMYFADSAGIQITDSKVNASLTITQATMTGCTVSNANQVVGSSTTFSFGFTPIVNITSNSMLQILIPAWFGNSSNLINNASANCSQSCSATLSSTT